MKRSSIVWIFLCIVMALMIIVGWSFPLTMLGTRLYYGFLKRDEWRQQTTPLDQATIVDLCEKFSMRPTDPLCKQTRSIYAPNFFDAIKIYFESNNATYDDVQAKLGNYQSKLEPLVTLGDGSKYFLSVYDLQGDAVTDMIFFFHEDGSIMKVIYKIGNTED